MPYSPPVKPSHGREEGEGDEVERKRREGEVVAVEAEQRHPISGRNDGGDDGRGEDREDGADPRLGSIPRVRRVKTDGEEARRCRRR